MHAEKNIHPNTFITKSNIFIRSTKCWQYVYFSSFVEEDIISTLEIPLCWAFLKVLPPLFALGSCHPKSDLWEKPQKCESQIFSMTAVWKQCRSTAQCVFMKIAKTKQIVLDKREINEGNRKQWTLCVPDKPDWPGFHLTIQFSIAVIFNSCTKMQPKCSLCFVWWTHIYHARKWLHLLYFQKYNNPLKSNNTMCCLISEFTSRPVQKFYGETENFQACLPVGTKRNLYEIDLD